MCVWLLKTKKKYSVSPRGMFSIQQLFSKHTKKIDFNDFKIPLPMSSSLASAQWDEEVQRRYKTNYFIPIHFITTIFSSSSIIIHERNQCEIISVLLSIYKTHLIAADLNRFILDPGYFVVFHSKYRNFTYVPPKLKSILT